MTDVVGMLLNRPDETIPQGEIKEDDKSSGLGIFCQTTCGIQMSILLLSHRNATFHLVQTGCWRLLTMVLRPTSDAVDA